MQNWTVNIIAQCFENFVESFNLKPIIIIKQTSDSTVLQHLFQFRRLDIGAISVFVFNWTGMMIQPTNSFDDLNVPSLTFLLTLEYLLVMRSALFLDEFVSMYRPAVHLHYDLCQRTPQQILHDMYMPNIFHLNWNDKNKLSRIRRERARINCLIKRMFNFCCHLKSTRNLFHTFWMKFITTTTT